MVENGDLHLPIGKPVKVLLRSIDVLHDFYVPEFRAKMDMVPGSVTYFWFTPDADRNIRGSVRGTVRSSRMRKCGATSSFRKSANIMHGWSSSRPSQRYPGTEPITKAR